MGDLRKAAEMALDGFEKIHKGFGAIKEESKFRGDEDIKDLATEVRKNCNKHIKALRQALAQSEQEREWVGLTDEDLKPLCDEWRIMYGGYVNDFAKAIEAKLKEKNT